MTFDLSNNYDVNKAEIKFKAMSKPNEIPVDETDEIPF